MGNMVHRVIFFGIYIFWEFPMEMNYILPGCWHSQGGAAKFAWPAPCPATKIYCNGKASMKTPGPENFTMTLAEFYSSEQGAEKWYTKLATRYGRKHYFCFTNSYATITHSHSLVLMTCVKPSTLSLKNQNQIMQMDMVAW